MSDGNSLAEAKEKGRREYLETLEKVAKAKQERNKSRSGPSQDTPGEGASTGKLDITGW